MTLALLIEFAWKSGLLAAAALAGAALLRSRPATERVVVLRLGVVMILTLPLLALLMPALRIETPTFLGPAETPVIAEAPAAAVRAPDSQAVAHPVITPATAPAPAVPAVAPASLDPRLAILGLWGAGVVLLLFRLGAGVIMLHRLTRRADPVSDARWLSALDQAAPRGSRPLLRASSRILSPLSWGIRPAVILLNPAALQQAGRADAILTHEMGHVRHGDWLFLMLTRAVVALLWFNPLVWLLQRELAHQSEQAADAWALRRIDRADYAGALVAMAACGRPHAALGMAAPRGELARRITAIMTTSRRRGGPWPTALAIAGCIGLATPLAALELASPAIAPALRLVLSPAGAPAPVTIASPILPPAPGAPPVKTAVAPDGDARRETVLRQREQGLAMMESGAREMESQADAMRSRAAMMSDPDDRAGLMADADDLDREAEDLRREARDLAARDWTELRPMTPEDERELFAGVVVNTNAAGVQVNANIQAGVSLDGRPPHVGPVPYQSPEGGDEEWRADEAAGLRQGARAMRQAAADMETGADEAERTPPDRRPPVWEMRANAAGMRRSADAMDARAAALD